jgi:hypothetical protein
MANDLESSIRELAESRARKVELAEWLTSGLRTRASEPAAAIMERPEREDSELVWMSQPKEASGIAEPAQPDAEGALADVAALAEVAASTQVAGAPVTLSEDEPTPRLPGTEDLPRSETPDTLQPHLLSKDLEDEDLAVLPSKPSLRVLGSAFGRLPLGGAWGALQRRPALKRSLAAAAMVLLFGALFFVRRGDAPTPGLAELAAVQSESAALLPPPPPESPVEAEVAPIEPPPPAAAKARGARHAARTVALEDELEGPRGPNVARYPDLPNRVLTRLAKTQDTARRSEPEPEAAASSSAEERPTWLLDLER